MEFQKIQNVSPKLSELVMQSLLNAIESGQLKVGEELPSERDLTVSMGVSRGSLRECLAILEYLNVIETRGNRKVVVKDAQYFRKAVSFVQLSGSQDVMDDCIEFRKTIEIAIVRLACKRATEEDLNHLNAIVLRLKKDLYDHVADVDFHNSLARASHNVFFISSMDLLSSVINDLRVRYYKLPAYYERTYESHCRIFEAVRKRDEDLAAEEMRQHLSLVDEFVEESSALAETDAV